MRQVLAWMTVAVLCGATGAAGEEQPDSRLKEAQEAYDEALTLHTAGKYAEALVKAEHALVLREAVLGGTHLDVAASLNRLAGLYKARGVYDRSERLHQRALVIREEVLGQHHPFVAQSLNDLALLRLAQNRLAEAVALFTRAFTLSEQRLRKEALGFSEARLASFLQLLRTHEERLHALLRAHPDDALPASSTWPPTASSWRTSPLPRAPAASETSGRWARTFSPRALRIPCCAPACSSLGRRHRQPPPTAPSSPRPTVPW